MSNVISLQLPARRVPLSQRTEQLAAVFAQHRRSPEDVFWLKENAEVLNILECTGLGLPQEALSHWQDFYDDLLGQLSFFPQYYRFFLSIALDLEALGMKGDVAEAACAFVARQDLPSAEFSDLQRAEARRLLARRGVETPAADPGLDARLHGFIDRSATFSLPNKKAAYELTHILFYLSEYGRKDPNVSDEAKRSLEYAGLLALLEQNMDLLAEICVAQRYAGVTPNPDWEAAVIAALGEFACDEAPVGFADGYHEYLVSGWSATLAGDAGMGCVVPDGPVAFHRDAQAGPLRSLSRTLLSLDRARSGNWSQMRYMLFDRMDDTERAILAQAEATSPHFDAFFEGFARASA